MAQEQLVQQLKKNQERSRITYIFWGSIRVISWKELSKKSRKFCEKDHSIPWEFKIFMEMAKPQNRCLLAHKAAFDCIWGTSRTWTGHSQMIGALGLIKDHTKSSLNKRLSQFFLGPPASAPCSTLPDNILATVFHTVLWKGAAVEHRIEASEE